MSRYSRNRYGSRSRYDSYSMYPQSKCKGERAADAARKAAALTKAGEKLSPVVLEGFALATTFWGKAWCKNIESYHDYANRLPRGRSYVRSNSVIDLQIQPGKIRALVMGSELYCVKIDIHPVAQARWAAIRTACAGKIGSLVELLRGRISGEVMEVMTRHDEGLFPKPSEITMRCSCPDSAGLCKHLAAVMYGIGNRLDQQPELLFLLRGVDSAELIAAATEAPAGAAPTGADTLDDAELADVFGVELEVRATPAASKVPAGKPSKSKTRAAAKPQPAKQPAAKPSPAEPPAKNPRGRPAKVQPATLSAKGTAKTAAKTKAKTVVKTVTKPKSKQG